MQFAVAPDIDAQQTSCDDVAVQADGRILVAGTDHDPDRSLVPRFRTDGRLDSTWAQRGWIRIDGIHGDATSISASRAGRVYVTGASFSDTGGDNYAVALLTSAGHLDPRFGSGGLALASPFNNGCLGANAVDHVVAPATGAVTVVGDGGYGNELWHVARFTSAGRAAPIAGTNVAETVVALAQYRGGIADSIPPPVRAQIIPATPSQVVAAGAVRVRVDSKEIARADVRVTLDEGRGPVDAAKLGDGSSTFASPGDAIVRVPLTAPGRRGLQGRRTAKVLITTAGRDPAGNRSSQTFQADLGP